MIGPFDVKHIIILLLKTVASNMKLWTNIINCIADTARPIKFVVILVIMSVSAFKPAVILYLL